MADSLDPSPREQPAGVRAARKRLGLSQDQAADLIGANRATFKSWDRNDRRPRDPEMLQVISEALQTPIHVLWPAENNPVAAQSLKSLREQRAIHHGQVLEAKAHEDAKAQLAGPQTNPAPEWTAPVEAPAARSVPDPREVLRTLDGEDDLPEGVSRPPRRWRRLLIPAAASLAIVAAAGTAIATTADDASNQPVVTAAQAGPSPAERQRIKQRAALNQAQQRGDFDEAITIAVGLDDWAASTHLRSTAAGILARRAKAAAERGDLPLATARLNKARKRYGASLALDAVRGRIRSIEKARRAQVDARKSAAKKRASERIRAAAAAQRQAAPPGAPRPSSSRATGPPSTPSTPNPAPSPGPTPPPTPTKSGGGSGSSSGSRRSSPVQPDFY